MTKTQKVISSKVELGAGEILRVMPNGEFIWHEDADEMIEHGDYRCNAGMPHLLRRLRMADKLESEIKNLHTVMMAAAVEITEHWDAHCDDEGYGPANLVRRLENGYPEQYGYDAQTMVRQDKRIAELENSNAVLLEALKEAPEWSM